MLSVLSTCPQTYEDLLKKRVEQQGAVPITRHDGYRKGGRRGNTAGNDGNSYDLAVEDTMLR